ncbi:MAG: glycosyltransferase family 39 protein [Planctomycetes bacterium]|nr:glycosyltransferase family 39 protein [Planctomycetota bacterium]
MVDPECPGRAERRTRFFALAAIALGCALRLTGLTLHSLWYDEGATLYLATAADPVEALSGSRHPPAAIYTIRAWIGLAGESDFALRLLPALCSIVSLALVARLSWLWLSGHARWIAVLLYAVAPFHLHYGQELTPYAFLELGSLIAFQGLGAALARDRPRALDLVLIALGTTYAFGSQYLGVLAGASVAGAAIVALASKRIRLGGAIQMIGASAIGGFVWLPWVLTVLPRQQETIWGNEARTSLREIVEIPFRLFVVDASALPGTWHFVGYGVAGALWAAMALSILALWQRERAEDRVLFAALAAPLLLALVLAAAFKNFLPRYLTAASPMLTLAVARGIDSLRPRLAVPAALALALGLSIFTVFHRMGNRREDFRSACADLEQRWRAGDACVVVSGTPELFAQGAVRHYLRQRPDILGSLGSLPPFQEGSVRIARGSSLHVIYRDNVYAEPDLTKLERTYARAEQSPLRFKIQYLRLEPK